MGKKQHKNLKFILGIIVGLLFSASSVYAVATVINSEDVLYDNAGSGGSSLNVQGSIDELYQKYKDLIGEGSSKYTESILHGADPVLGDKMIPITIDAKGTVKYANQNTPWYSYAEKRWANAVILVSKPSANYQVGQTIAEKDIESYFVWIPRYSYKIWDMGNYSNYQNFASLVDSADAASAGGATAFRRVTKNSRLIDVKFGSDLNEVGKAVGDYHTNEAFSAFNTKGFWVGKFETGYNQTGDGSNPIDTEGWTVGNAQKDELNEKKIVVKPNVYSWRNITVGNIFNNALNYETTLKSHMMKNTEWGAVAYLSHSAYGIGNEININNNSSYKTGYSAAANTDQSSYTGENGTAETVTQPYNTPTGYLASTTGNITGVYDMSGGAHEYMAAYRTGQNSATSGVTDSMLSTYAKYFDVYGATTNWYDYSKRKLGDATGEMGPFYYYYDKDKNIRAHNAWYADHSHFVDSTNPWFHRGGILNGGVLAGQFYFHRDTGGVSTYDGSRLVLSVN